MNQTITTTIDIQQHPNDIPTQLNHLRNQFGHTNITTTTNPLTGHNQLIITFPSHQTQPKDEDDFHAIATTVYEHCQALNIVIYAISVRRVTH